MSIQQKAEFIKADINRYKELNQKKRAEILQLERLILKNNVSIKEREKALMELYSRGFSKDGTTKNRFRNY
jgi:hypothetical protein